MALPNTNPTASPAVIGPLLLLKSLRRSNSPPGQPVFGSLEKSVEEATVAARVTSGSDPERPKALLQR